MSSSESNSPTPVEVSSISTSSTPTRNNDVVNSDNNNNNNKNNNNDIVDKKNDLIQEEDDETCVLSQGRICICNSCDDERKKLELSRKRKRTSLQQSTSTQTVAAATVAPSSLSTDYCHEVGKPDSEAVKLQKMASACKTILKCIGEDPSREGLLKTPERWAKALLFMTSGYSLSAAEVVNGAVFTEDSHKEIVVVKDIDIHSMCEHHMVPFTGRIHVGYIPNGKSEFYMMCATYQIFVYMHVLL